MEWTVIGVGKHGGKSLPQIIFNDADWFFHAYENGYFKGPADVEARELYRRARSIKIPQRNGQKMLVEYLFHSGGGNGSGKFGTMRLIADGPGLGHLNVSHVIDFYVPRSMARYDKTGYKYFVATLKAILWGDPSKRMNRRACEAFFEDDGNFVL